MTSMSAAWKRLEEAVERAEKALADAEAKGDAVAMIGAYGEAELLREQAAELDPKGTQEAMDAAGADVMASLLGIANEDTTTTEEN